MLLPPHARPASLLLLGLCVGVSACDPDAQAKPGEPVVAAQSSTKDAEIWFQTYPTWAFESMVMNYRDPSKTPLTSRLGGKLEFHADGLFKWTQRHLGSYSFTNFRNGSFRVEGDRLYLDQVNSDGETVTWEYTYLLDPPRLTLIEPGDEEIQQIVWGLTLCGLENPSGIPAQDQERLSDAQASC